MALHSNDFYCPIDGTEMRLAYKPKLSDGYFTNDTGRKSPRYRLYECTDCSIRLRYDELAGFLSFFILCPLEGCRRTGRPYVKTVKGRKYWYFVHHRGRPKSHYLETYGEPRREELEEEAHNRKAWREMIRRARGSR